MGTYQSLLERLATYASAIPNGQAYLKAFLRRLVENPGSVTVQEMGLVSGLTQISPEDLLILCLYWSEEDMDLELGEL
jgi:hypothetical protein